MNKMMMGAVLLLGFAVVDVEAAGGGGGTGKVSMQDFHFTSRANKATPRLADGSVRKPAVARKAGKGQQEYMQIKLTDVLISSYRTGSGKGAGPAPKTGERMLLPAVQKVR